MPPFATHVSLHTFSKDCDILFLAPLTSLCIISSQVLGVIQSYLPRSSAPHPSCHEALTQLIKDNSGHRGHGAVGLGLSRACRKAVHLGTDVGSAAGTDSRHPEGSMGITSGYGARPVSQGDPGSWQRTSRWGDHRAQKNVVGAPTRVGATPWRDTGRHGRLLTPSWGGLSSPSVTQQRHLGTLPTLMPSKSPQHGPAWSSPCVKDRGLSGQGWGKGGTWGPGVREMPGGGTGELTLTGQRGSFWHERKHSGRGWGPSKGLGLGPRTSPSSLNSAVSP